MKKELFGNLLVTGIGRFAGMFIQLAVTLILSRFLAPDNFGVIAMCSIFLSISEMLIDSGMGGSIIFHKDVKEIELHTLFWTNLLLSIVIYLLLFSFSEAIAIFYEQEILKNIIRVIGISIIVHSFCIIQNSLLSKNLQFKVQSKIMLISSICSSIIVLILGYNRFGVWTLVAQPILLKTFQVFFYLRLGLYKPKLQYSIHSLKRHWVFGSRLLGSSSMKLLYDNLYIQIIGKVINITDAGYYVQAKRFNDVPTDLLTFSLDKVVFPTLVKSKNMSHHMNAMSILFASFVIPILFLGSLVSNELINILLGSKWSDSGWMLSFMLFGAVAVSMEVLSRCFLKATGKTSILLKYDFIKRIVNILILIFSVRWLIKGLLVAFIINSIIGCFFNYLALSKAINYTLKNQLVAVVPIVATALVPYIFIQYVFLSFNTSVWLSLLAKTSLYIVLYMFIIYSFRKREVEWLVTSIRQIFNNNLHGKAL